VFDFICFTPNGSRFDRAGVLTEREIVTVRSPSSFTCLSYASVFAGLLTGVMWFMRCFRRIDQGWVNLALRVKRARQDPGLQYPT
jgi:hypothetical protein